MNSKNRAKLNKAIEILNGLHFKNENIMVTGSIALDAQGLLTDRIAHDVDLIIKMDEQTWRCLKLIRLTAKPLGNENFHKGGFYDYPDETI